MRNRVDGRFGIPFARSASPCATLASTPPGSTASVTPQKSIASSSRASSEPRGAAWWPAPCPLLIAR